MANRSINLGIRLYRDSSDYRHQAIEKWYDSLPSLNDGRKRGCQDVIINALYAAITSGQAGTPLPPAPAEAVDTPQPAKLAPKPGGNSGAGAKNKPGKKPGSFRNINF